MHVLIIVIAAFQRGALYQCPWLYIHYYDCARSFALDYIRCYAKLVVLRQKLPLFWHAIPHDAFFKIFSIPALFQPLPFSA